MRVPPVRGGAVQPAHDRGRAMLPIGKVQRPARRAREIGRPVEPVPGIIEPDRRIRMGDPGAVAVAVVGVAERAGRAAHIDALRQLPAEPVIAAGHALARDAVEAGVELQAPYSLARLSASIFKRKGDDGAVAGAAGAAHQPVLDVVDEGQHLARAGPGGGDETAVAVIAELGRTSGEPCKPTWRRINRAVPLSLSRRRSRT